MLIIKKLLILIFLNIIVILQARSEIAGYRIFFADKGPEVFAPGSAIYENTRKIHNEKCTERRLRINAITPFTVDDAPIYDLYMDAVQKFGAKIRLKLRWKNYIVAECDSATAKMIEGLDFVTKVQKSSSRFIADSYTEIPDINGDNDYIYEDNTHSGCGSFYYGQSANQLDMLNIIKLHSLGITGNGVVIGLIDSGFDTGLSTFSHAKILGAYDFINGDSIVKDDKNDKKLQDPHGTMVLSTIAAFTHDNLIGAAPFSSILLAKTEDLSSERLTEEDNLAAAVEWLESKGADIISVSLSYNQLDSTDESHKPEEFDGKTTIAAIALNEATARGVVCVASSGNKGPAAGTIHTPADSDSAITVGAVLPDGVTPAPFTSRGYMPDGGIKPDIAAQGKDVITIHPEKKHLFFKAEGSSFSAPLIAGSVALMLNVHPDMKPWQVKKALIENATQKNRPDTAVGYGVPDVFEAIRRQGTVITPPAIYPSKSKLNIFTNIYAESESVMKLYFRDAAGGVFIESGLDRPDLYSYVGHIPLNSFIDTAEFYITVSNSKGVKRYPFKENEYLKAAPNSMIIPCGIGQEALYEYHPEFTAGIYPNILYGGNNEIEVYINLILSSTIKIGIYSADGTEILYKDYGLFNAGMNYIPVNITNLSSGVYFLKVKNVTDYDMMKFIVIN